MCEKVDGFWFVIHQKDILKERGGKYFFLNLFRNYNLKHEVRSWSLENCLALPKYVSFVPCGPA